jgi:hypothetical protein
LKPLPKKSHKHTDDGSQNTLREFVVLIIFSTDGKRDKIPCVLDAVKLRPLHMYGSVRAKTLPHCGFIPSTLLRNT